MDNQEINKYAAELSALVQSFIADYEHPEDGILLINLANIDEHKVVYIEETLIPGNQYEDWAEYPLIDLIVDKDAPSELWEVDNSAVYEVAAELLNV